MKTWLRRSLWSVGTLVAVGAATIAAGLFMAERKMQRNVVVDVRALPLPTDAVAIERGRYLFASRGCAECHGANGGGRTFIDEDGLRVAGAHISPGPGSVTAGYAAADWVRTIRHGVKPDGRPVMIMPSEDYNRFTDADVGALVAYVQQMPAVEGGAAVVQLPPPVRLMYAFGLVQDAAEKIDHRLPAQQPVAEGPGVEHGRYVANMCLGCHGDGLSGGKIPGTPPSWPAAANLTPGEGSVMPAYADEQAFVRLMRSGKRADGSAVTVMPFESLAQMSDVDLRALHAFLLTVPPRPAGGR
ncbi:MAG: cytochrome c [Rubrivivax sp.]